jgi:hypothetical protein
MDTRIVENYANKISIFGETLRLGEFNENS